MRISRGFSLYQKRLTKISLVFFSYQYKKSNKASFNLLVFLLDYTWFFIVFLFEKCPFSAIIAIF